MIRIRSNFEKKTKVLFLGDVVSFENDERPEKEKISDEIINFNIDFVTEISIRM